MCSLFVTVISLICVEKVMSSLSRASSAIFFLSQNGLLKEIMDRRSVNGLKERFLEYSAVQR